MIGRLIAAILGVAFCWFAFIFLCYIIMNFTSGAWVGII